MSTCYCQGGKQKRAAESASTHTLGIAREFIARGTAMKPRCYMCSKEADSIMGNAWGRLPLNYDSLFCYAAFAPTEFVQASHSFAPHFDIGFNGLATCSDLFRPCTPIHVIQTCSSELAGSTYRKSFVVVGLDQKSCALEMEDDYFDLTFFASSKLQ
jgi:hypothetical protein